MQQVCLSLGNLKVKVCSATHKQHKKCSLPNHHLVFSKIGSTLQKARYGITFKKLRQRLKAYGKADLKESKDNWRAY